MYRYVQEAKTLAVIISLFSNTISRIWYNIALGFMGPHGPPPRFLCSAYYFSAACSNISQNTKEPCDVRIFPRTWCVWNQWSIHSGIEQVHCAKHSTKKNNCDKIFLNPLTPASNCPWPTPNFLVFFGIFQSEWKHKNKPYAQ